MSRITQGKIELRRERVELAPIVDQAVEAAACRSTGSMGHELTVTLARRSRSTWTPTRPAWPRSSATS